MITGSNANEPAQIAKETGALAFPCSPHRPHHPRPVEVQLGAQLRRQRPLPLRIPGPAVRIQDGVRGRVQLVLQLGECVGVTLDGRLFRQRRSWGGKRRTG